MKKVSIEKGKLVNHIVRRLCLKGYGLEISEELKVTSKSRFLFQTFYSLSYYT